MRENETKTAGKTVNVGLNSLSKINSMVKLICTLTHNVTSPCHSWRV